MPAPSATAGELWEFGTAQTGQLDKANGHTSDVLEIVEKCEARDAATIKRLTRPWWKFWN